MIVEKLHSEKFIPLWEFVRQRLPSSLRAVNCIICGIDIKTRDIKSYFAFEKGPLIYSKGIASVFHEKIELRDPDWLPFFEKTVLEYEAQTGKEVKIRCWVS